MGAGDRGGMFGQGQFTPRLSSTKLSEGGIITKPTTGTLEPGSSVIPLNRNNAVADTFQAAKETAGDASIADPMAQAATTIKSWWWSADCFAIESDECSRWHR